MEEEKTLLKLIEELKRKNELYEQLFKLLNIRLETRNTYNLLKNTKHREEYLEFGYADMGTPEKEAITIVKKLLCLKEDDEN